MVAHVCECAEHTEFIHGTWADCIGCEFSKTVIKKARGGDPGFSTKVASVELDRSGLGGQGKHSCVGWVQEWGVLLAGWREDFSSQWEYSPAGKRVDIPGLGRRPRVQW